ncbi:MAG: hypothetical protein IPM61_16420 [Chlorobi bacterium]|nr:hypothetical protein [Chlorobiota bacterium]
MRAGRVGEYRYVNTARVEQPIVKRDGTQAPASPGDAFAAVAERLRKIKPEYVAVIGSPYATNEENYVLNRFAREVIRIQNVDFVRHSDPDLPTPCSALPTAPRTLAARWRLGLFTERGDWGGSVDGNPPQLSKRYTCWTNR